MAGGGLAQTPGDLQRLRALQLANRVRSERARLKKRRLAAGELGAAQMIERQRRLLITALTA